MGKTQRTKDLRGENSNGVARGPGVDLGRGKEGEEGWREPGPAHLELGSCWEKSLGVLVRRAGQWLVTN